MTITTKLTDRDKALLKILAVFLIVMGFIMLGILPSLDKKSELEESIAFAEADRDAMEMELAMLPSYEKTAALYEEERAGLVADFYPMTENQEIDKMITGMVFDFGLTARDFTVSVTPALRGITPYFASDKALLNAAGGEEGAKTYTGDVYTADISVKAIGSAEDIRRLLDSVIDGYPALRVTSYSIAEGEKIYLGENQEAYTASTLTLNMEMYMCYK